MKFIAASLALASLPTAWADGHGPVCDPVGVFDGGFLCEDGGETLGPFNQVFTIFDMGDGFYNYWAQLEALNYQFNFTMARIPGEENGYQGGNTFINFEPGPIGADAYQPGHIPLLVPFQVHFNEECNFYVHWMYQRPGFGRGGDEPTYTPPTHLCHAEAIRRVDDSSPVEPDSVDPSDVPTSSPAGTIVDLAVGTDELSTLTELLAAAGLVEVLGGQGPFTVFAPTNAAFDNLPADVLASLAANIDDLVNVLTYHVVSDAVILSTDLSEGATVTTVNGDSLTVTSLSPPTINESIVIQADIMASNGVVHLIDTVLVPAVEEEEVEDTLTADMAPARPNRITASSDDSPGRRNTQEIKPRKMKKSTPSKKSALKKSSNLKPRSEAMEEATEVDRKLQASPFLADYNAIVKCFVGDQELEEYMETHTFFEVTASEVGHYGVRRTRRNGGDVALDTISQSIYEPLEFLGGTTNITGYNMDESDPAYFDEDLIPLISVDIQFLDDSYDEYQMILVGSRPGPQVQGYNLGAHVCRVEGWRQGTQYFSLPDDSCNPSGRYDTAAHCRTYRTSLGEIVEDDRVESLGHGFYSFTQYYYGQYPDEVPDGTADLWVRQTLLVADLTNPGFYKGATYYRNDYLTAEVSVVEFPTYVEMQFYFEDMDGDGMCDSFSANSQNYRPGPDVGPFTRQGMFNSDDVVHFCQYDGSTIHLGAVVDESCMDGTSGCTGICWEGQYDYVSTCIAGVGRDPTPNFVREVLAPSARVLEGSCASHGFTLSTACPDDFYGLNDVCLFSNDPTDEFLSSRAPGFFNPEVNPYVGYFEFPWGLYWRNDNQECQYRAPGTPSPITPSEVTTCGFAGRWNCPNEVCVNGTIIVIDGSQEGSQELLITDRGNNYYDISVPNNPFGVNWQAIMYQRQYDKFTLTGAMWNVSNHESTYDHPDHQLIEITIDPTYGCSTFEFILLAYTSVPREWESPFHICDMTCERIQGFGPTLASLM